MADKQVKVVVDLSATGNLGNVLKDVRNQIAAFKEHAQTAGAVAAKGMAIMTASAAAASPAVFHTLAGSVQLAAGELGMMFIPAVVEVSRFLQDLAGKIRDFNDATGGVVGKVLGLAAAFGTAAWIGAKLVDLAMPVVNLGRWLLQIQPAQSAATTGLANVATAANTAAAALSSTAGAAGASGAASAVGAAGAGIGMGGRLVRGLGIAGLGVAASQLAGGVIGGRGGDYVGSVGSGASIGAAIGSVIAPGIGTAIGAALGGVAGIVKEMVGGGSGGSDARSKFAMISMNMSAGGGDIGGLHAAMQREAIRDPMSQARFEQEVRANDTLIKEIHNLGLVIGRLDRNVVAP